MLYSKSRSANSNNDPAAITGNSGISSANQRNFANTSGTVWISSKNKLNPSAGASTPVRRARSSIHRRGPLPSSRKIRENSGFRSKFTSKSTRPLARAKSLTNHVFPTCRAPRTINGFRRSEISQDARKSERIRFIIILK